MADLAQLASIPDVKGVVLGDLSGTLVDAVREPDGETTAAVMGYVASMLSQAGEYLGLGALYTATMAGPGSGRALGVRPPSVLAASVESAKSLGAVEKAIDAALRGRS